MKQRLCMKSHRKSHRCNFVRIRNYDQFFFIENVTALRHERIVRLSFYHVIKIFDNAKYLPWEWSTGLPGTRSDRFEFLVSVYICMYVSMYVSIYRGRTYLMGVFKSEMKLVWIIYDGCISKLHTNVPF